MWSNCKHILVRNQNYGFKNNCETTFVWIKVDWAPCHTIAFQAKEENNTVSREGTHGFPSSDLPHGLGILSLTFLPASGVQLSLGKLLKQARRNSRSYWICS